MFTILKYKRKLIKIFFILFFGFLNVNSLKTSAINCSSPVHKNKAICRSKSDIDPKIDPKELIEKTTVAIIGVKGIDEPGSGVIVKKEDNIYSILTSAHVVCNKKYQLVDTEEYALKTFDGTWHDSNNFSNLKVNCPPILKRREKISNTFCSAAVSNSYPWPIDIAVLEFKSNKE